MGVIGLGKNHTSLQVQRRLNVTNDELQTSAQRLSSGQRINSASDDAAGIAVAASLNADARVYSQGVRNLNDGISLLNIADGVVQSLSDIAGRLKELATQAANGVYSAKQRAAINKEGQALTSEFNRIIESATFNGTRIFKSHDDVLTIQSGYGSADTISVEYSRHLFNPAGDGTFQTPTTIASQAYITTVKTGDVNSDGKEDLILQGLGSIQTNLGNGDGTFQGALSTGVGGNSVGFATGDLNRDGKLDYISASGTANTISVHIGNGDGTFAARVNYAAGDISTTSTFSDNLAAVDLNNDGNLDVISASLDDGAISVFIGNGDGTLQARSSFTVAGAAFEFFEVADFNTDGNLDLVATSNGDGAYVFIGNGNGSFQSPQSYATGSLYTKDVTVLDANNDGNLDFMTAVGSQSLQVWLGDGSGSFSAGSSIASSAANARHFINSTDLNGDRNDDIVVSDGGTLSFLFGNGDGTFDAEITQILSGGDRLALADFNGDGASDIAFAPTQAAASNTNILLGNVQYIAGISSLNLLSQQNARSALSTIEEIQLQVQSARGEIGVALTRMEVRASVKRVAADTLRSAESRITDTDIAEEAAKLISARIRNQVQGSILNQVNMIPALALKLLRE